MSNNFLQGVNVYLIGMMGAGKSTVGKVLAEKLRYTFLDTDDLIVQAAGQPITEIFATAGESDFRDLESQVLSGVSAYQKLVVATGGGIILRPINWSYLHHGVVVWLNVPLNLLYLRLQDDQTRPLLQDADPLAKLTSILEQRQHLYAQADVTINIEADHSPELIAGRAIAALEKLLRESQKS